MRVQSLLEGGGGQGGTGGGRGGGKVWLQRAGGVVWLLLRSHLFLLVALTERERGSHSHG
jgi:hypothetical protein